MDDPGEMHFYLVFVYLWLVFAYSRAALIAVLAGAIAAEYLFQLDAGAYSRTLVFFGAFFLSGVLISRLRRLDEPASAGPLWFLGFPDVWRLRCCSSPTSISPFSANSDG